MSQTPEGATHFGQGYHCKFWVKDIRPGVSYQFANVYHDGPTNWMIRLGEPEYPITAIEPTWTGEGLPPAGIDVEIHNKSGRGVVEGAESFIGTTCKVLAAFVNMNGFEMVSVEDSGGSCMCFRADMCGPVRTPEQIAAEVRQLVIDELVQLMRRSSGNESAAAKMYDAGYRKFEILDN